MTPAQQYLKEMDRLPVEDSDDQSYRDWCPSRRGDIKCSLDLDHEGSCNFEPLPVEVGDA
ncbi:hypothetical protein LCGC14_1632830 [marine sediment metagenome]|uniref:Uncharacterized protein n=1 Tax=marine sediment metagenome TaxID=412755 RepID=A0A0F9IPC6_9ZZZZ